MQSIEFDPVGVVGLLQMQCATSMGLRRSPTDKQYKREGMETEIQNRLKNLKS